MSKKDPQPQAPRLKGNERNDPRWDSSQENWDSFVKRNAPTLFQDAMDEIAPILTTKRNHAEDAKRRPTELRILGKNLPKDGIFQRLLPGFLKPTFLEKLVKDSVKKVAQAQYKEITSRATKALEALDANKEKEFEFTPQKPPLTEAVETVAMAYSALTAGSSAGQQIGQKSSVVRAQTGPARPAIAAPAYIPPSKAVPAAAKKTPAANVQKLMEERKQQPAKTAPSNPAVKKDAVPVNSGGFTYVPSTRYESPKGYEVYLDKINPLNNATLGEVRVNNFTDGNQISTALVVTGDGQRALVVYGSNNLGRDGDTVAFAVIRIPAMVVEVSDYIVDRTPGVDETNGHIVLTTSNPNSDVYKVTVDNLNQNTHANYSSQPMTIEVFRDGRIYGTFADGRLEVIQQAQPSQLTATSTGMNYSSPGVSSSSGSAGTATADSDSTAEGLSSSDNEWSFQKGKWRLPTTIAGATGAFICCCLCVIAACRRREEDKSVEDTTLQRGEHLPGTSIELTEASKTAEDHKGKGGGSVNTA